MCKTQDKSFEEIKMMSITKGLPQNYYSVAVELFLNALGEKFTTILGDKNKAKELLELSINPHNCFSAIGETELLGVLAFQIKNTNFLSFTFKMIISVYGFMNGIIKMIGLSMLIHKSNSDEIYLEAIAVSESARGKGVGTQLIETLFLFAKENNFKFISLQVIDTNPKAKELYEHLGFRVVKKTSIWPVNKIIGFPFNEVFLMKKEM
jgi:ribosomal protein S18 acetylase RimI-like enzyme